MPTGVYQHKRRLLEDRFWARVDVGGPADCWEWTGSKNHNGYGQIREGASGSRLLLAHRVSWEIENGLIQKGLCVLHRYDNPSCVNPAHLFLGTVADNNHDMIKKGRDIKACGEEQGSVILTEQDVHEVRQMLSRSISQRVIAKKYGVTHMAISNINTGKTWAWLKEAK